MEKKMMDGEVIIHIAKEIYVIASMVASAHARVSDIKKELQATVGTGKSKEDGQHWPDMEHGLRLFAHTAYLAADLVEKQCDENRLGLVSENIRQIQEQSKLDLAKHENKRQIAAFKNQWHLGIREMEEFLEEMAETPKGGSYAQRTAEMLLMCVSEHKKHIACIEDVNHRTYMLVCAMEKAFYRTSIDIRTLVSEMDRQRTAMQKVCMELEAALAK